MDLTRQILVWAHIILGFTGLVAFWFPIFSRKGSRLHKRIGRIFVNCGYGVTISAAASCFLAIVQGIQHGVLREDPGKFAMALFLGYLALVTFVTLRHSMRVLEHKKDPAGVSTPLDRGLAAASIGASLGLIVFALNFFESNGILLLALSPIGLNLGWGIFRYAGQQNPSKHAWFYEHISAILGAGIAFHTAFAVFGLQRFLDVSSAGLIGLIPWVMPAAIGIPATSLWIRHYKKKFGELKPRAAMPEAGTVTAQS